MVSINIHKVVITLLNFGGKPVCNLGYLSFALVHSVVWITLQNQTTLKYVVAMETIVCIACVWDFLLLMTTCKEQEKQTKTLQY